MQARDVCALWHPCNGKGLRDLISLMIEDSGNVLGRDREVWEAGTENFCCVWRVFRASTVCREMKINGDL